MLNPDVYWGSSVMDGVSRGLFLRYHIAARILTYATPAAYIACLQPKSIFMSCLKGTADAFVIWVHVK